MKKNKKNILKAGVCLAVIIAMLLPSAGAMNKIGLQLPGISSVFISSGSLDQDGMISGDGLTPVQTVTFHGLSNGVTSTVQFQQNTDQYTFDVSSDPPDVDSGLCGVVESKNGNLFANAFPLVHTYNDQIPPPMLIKMIYVNLFANENRPGRTKAYLVTPTIDHKMNIGDNAWAKGILLGGIIVWENQVLPYTYIGRLGFGMGTLEDHIYPFRTHVFLWNEVARGYDPDGGMWVRFVIGSEKVSNTGYWFNDQYPYNDDTGIPLP